MEEHQKTIPLYLIYDARLMITVCSEPDQCQKCGRRSLPWLQQAQGQLQLHCCSPEMLSSPCLSCYPSLQTWHRGHRRSVDHWWIAFCSEECHLRRCRSTLGQWPSSNWQVGSGSLVIQMALHDQCWVAAQCIAFVPEMRKHQIDKRECYQYSAFAINLFMIQKQVKNHTVQILSRWINRL